MYRKKELDNILPFNEIWYSDCYHHAIFSMLPYFSRNIYPFLIEDIYFYDFGYKEKEFYLNINNINSKHMNEILIDIGIANDKKFKSEDIINDIIRALLKDRPVIIFVDCYYLSIRSDFYLREHVGHSILIYGFDESSQEFNIVEHNYINSQLFEKRKISYTDIINSYKGLINEIIPKMDEEHLQNASTFNEYYLKETTEKNNLINSVCIKEKAIYAYSNLMLKNKSRIMNGVDDLYLFIDELSTLLNDKVQLLEKIESVLNAINGIINTILLDKYRIQKFFTDSHVLIDFLEVLINAWGLLRVIVAKIKYSGDYEELGIETCIKKIEIIKENHRRYYEELYLFINKLKGDLDE